MTKNEKIMKYLKKNCPLNENKQYNPLKKLILYDKHIIHISDDIKNYLEHFKYLEELTLSLCDLTSLHNIPDLPKLLKIDLSDNYIKGEELLNLCKYKNLRDINLSNNNIYNFEEIKCLENLNELSNLDFTDSPITQIQNYREKIFEKFKKLKLLDGKDKYGNTEKDEDEDGFNFEEIDFEKDEIFIDDGDQEEEEEEEESNEYD